jgi:hypothetical protein
MTEAEHALVNRLAQVYCKRWNTRFHPYTGVHECSELAIRTTENLFIQILTTRYKDLSDIPKETTDEELYKFISISLCGYVL